MPFTPAHSAAVLPLIGRKYFSATALVAGSIAPDFEYFLRLSVNSIHSHTIPGLFYFDVPVAILLGIIFHTIVKNNLFSNLPAFIRARFRETMTMDFMVSLRQNYLMIITSALIGATTHVFWDEFTHNKGYFAQTLPIYKGTFLPLFGVRWPLFFVLQHVSTLLGTIALLIFILRKPAGELDSLRAGNPASYWLKVFLVIVIVLAVRFLVEPRDLNPGNFIVTFISGFCLGLILTGTRPSHKSSYSG